MPFTPLVPAGGRRWPGRGTAFTGQKTQLDCTLLGWWSAGHQDAGLMLTDLPPHAAQACWYGLRAWIEQGFNRIKRGGWQWQYPRLDDPARAERLWLAIAIAPWWLLSVGGEADATVPAATWPPVPGAARQQGRRWRVVGIFRQGWNLIMVALLNHQPLPLGHACPEPWPERPQLENNALTAPNILSA